MALDGFVISNIVSELNQTILNAKISKIAQPETDELLFTCKGSNGQYRLAMSASASLPSLPDQPEQAEPDDCAEFLHGAA